MVLGRSREGVDFDALDGRPTHLFFVLGLRFDELHLPWLAKLVQVLMLPAVLLHEYLADAERRLLPAVAVDGMIADVGATPA